MVEVTEVDDEGRPLRSGDDSLYIRRGPTWSERLRASVSCWSYCHMSLAIWITLIIFTVLVALGAVVLSANSSARSASEPQCHRLFNWVLFFVVVTGANAVWYAVEEGFRVPPLRIDPTSPNGVSETPLHEQNSLAYVYVRAFRIVLHLALTLVFVVVGGDVLVNSTCQGHADLWLYFKAVWWTLIVIYGLLTLLLCCGACVAVAFFAIKDRRQRADEE
jgi:hypothetical protein